jgi:hypothetical protein
MRVKNKGYLKRYIISDLDGEMREAACSKSTFHPDYRINYDMTTDGKKHWRFLSVQGVVPNSHAIRYTFIPKQRFQVSNPNNFNGSYTNKLNCSLKQNGQSIMTILRDR